MNPHGRLISTDFLVLWIELTVDIDLTVFSGKTRWIGIDRPYQPCSPVGLVLGESTSTVDSDIDCD